MPSFASLSAARWPPAPPPHRCRRQRSRADGDERRRQILAAARRLFSERGYSAVSTTEIAAEAGVARGLINHYFGTKRELYVEVVREMVRFRSQPVPEYVDGTTPQARLERVDRPLAGDGRAQPRGLARRRRRRGPRPRPRDRGRPRRCPRGGDDAADPGARPRPRRGCATRAPRGAARLRRDGRGGDARMARARSLEPRAGRGVPQGSASGTGRERLRGDPAKQTSSNHRRRRDDEQDLRDRRRHDQVRQARHQGGRLPGLGQGGRRARRSPTPGSPTRTSSRPSPATATATRPPASGRSTGSA